MHSWIAAPLIIYNKCSQNFTDDNTTKMLQFSLRVFLLILEHLAIYTLTK